MRRRITSKQQKAVDPGVLCYAILDAQHEKSRNYTKIYWGSGASANRWVYNSFGKFTDGSVTTVIEKDDAHHRFHIDFPEEYQSSPLTYLTTTNFPQGITFSSFFYFNELSVNDGGINFTIGNMSDRYSAIRVYICTYNASSMRVGVYSDAFSNTVTHMDSVVNVNNHVNKWHHLAFTWKANYLYVWLNGTRIMNKIANQEEIANTSVRGVTIGLYNTGAVYDSMIYKGDYFGTGSTIQVPTEVFNIYI